MNPTHTLSETARPIIQALFTKAYTEQAIGDAPWGLDEKGHCSYLAGCAIGRSLTPDVAGQIGGSITGVFGYAYPELGYYEARAALTGDPLPRPVHDPDVRCLQAIQTAHDIHARLDDRKMYAAYLEQVARDYGLELPDL